MKIVLINGSPKNGLNASEVILGGLRQGFLGDNEIVECKAIKTRKDEFFEIIHDADALVFSFPLYVDGLPSHLLRLICDVFEEIKTSSAKTRVYAISNNGFFEGEQNEIALEILENYCSATGLIWGQGMGVGAGPIMHIASMGKGPMKSIGKALMIMAKKIEQGQSGENVYVRPNLAKFIYIKAAHMDWKKQGRRNGLKPVDLYHRL